MTFNTCLIYETVDAGRQCKAYQQVALAGGSYIPSNTESLYTDITSTSQGSNTGYNTGTNIGINSSAWATSHEMNATAANFYNPPFLYTYQCGSAVISNYTPILLYCFALSGLVLPILTLLVITFRRTLSRILPLSVQKAIFPPILLINSPLDVETLQNDHAQVISCFYYWYYNYYYCYY